jgi:hypothetical protein
MNEVAAQLQRIASFVDFSRRLSELVDGWESSGAGVEIVDPILRFMESHPFHDYGSPGPLVHFMELFYGSGYDEKLVQSVRRKPTLHTVWMLNRLINGAKSPGVAQSLLEAMEQAAAHPTADLETMARVAEYLERAKLLGLDRR